MRINKTTTIGAVAACAVIGATRPVWVDSGSNGSAEQAAQRAAAVNALRAEVAKLTERLQADDAALQSASEAARAEAHALAAERADVARWKAFAERAKTQVRTVTVPQSAPPSSFGRDKFAHHSFDSNGGYPCHHHFGDSGQSGDFQSGDAGSWDGGGDQGGQHDGNYGTNWQG